MTKKEYKKAVSKEIHGESRNIIKNWLSIKLNENKHVIYLIRKQLYHMEFNQNLYGKICNNVKIGANSLVIHDIANPGVYVGSPVIATK